MAKTSGISRRGFVAGSAAAVATARVAWSKEDRRLKLCVLGASGTVGNAVVREALSAGHHVIAVSRSSDKLAKILAQYPDRGVKTVIGDVGSDESAARLRKALLERTDKPDAVVAALSSPDA